MPEASILASGEGMTMGDNMTDESDERSVCGPDFASWYSRGRWPSCACGFSPRDNAALNDHWRAAGFTVVDNQGSLETRPVTT